MRYNKVKSVMPKYIVIKYDKDMFQLVLEHALGEERLEAYQ
jgi:hypothetical protein